MKIRLLLLATASLAMCLPALQAQIIPIPLTGNTQYDGWGDWPTIPGSYGGFPGNGTWAVPLGSNLAGSGDAAITKTNGPGGGPYKGNESIYFGSFTNVPNTLGGTLTFTDTTVVSSLKTVVFQLAYGEANGFDFLNNDTDLKITLQTTEGELVLSADYYFRNHQLTGEFPNPEDPDGPPLEIYTNYYGYQWDFTGLYDEHGPGFAISSYGITFSGVQHSQIYGAQLNQSDTFTQVIPEPSTYALLALGFGLFAWKARRRLSTTV